RRTYDSFRSAKDAPAKICARPAAAIQRNEYLCAIGRDRTNSPFTVANSSSSSQTDCERLLSHSKRPRALADVARKSVFAAPLMEFFAEDYCRLGRLVEGG